MPLNNVPLLSFSEWLGHWMCTHVVLMMLVMMLTWKRMRMIMMDVVGCGWSR